MIKQVKINSEIEQFLAKQFKNYKPTADPYEKLLVYIAGSIIGVISYSIIYDRAEINYIAVDKKHQKKGIGTMLLNKAIEDIKNSCASISLEVKTTNTKAINLYSKFNFQIKATRKNYYGNQDAYLMVKEIR